MKLITKNILRLEDKLRAENKLVQFARSQTDGAYPGMTERAMKYAAAADAVLQAAMDISPEVIERDTMPSEVATEQLLGVSGGLGRMTNRQRKTFQSARETHYVSVVPRKPGATKLAARLSTAELAQLGRWLRRSIYRRAGTLRVFNKIAHLADPKSKALQQMIMTRGINLDIARAQIESELTRRNIPFVCPEPRKTFVPETVSELKPKARESILRRIGKFLTGKFLTGKTKQNTPALATL